MALQHFERALDVLMGLSVAGIILGGLCAVVLVLGRIAKLW